MPKNYGLLEAPVIVTNLKNRRANIILDQWWKYFYESKTYRDQIALPYVLWKNNIKVDEVGTLCDNIWMDSKIEKERHINIK